MKEPKIRFKGFSGEWEETKFGNLCSVAMCKRIFKHQTSPQGDIPFYKIGTFGATPDAFISRTLFEEYKKKYNYPQKGDILISAAGTIGRVVEYTGEECYYQDSNIVWLKHSDQLSNAFLKQLYPIINWSSLEGATIKRLYNGNILDTSFRLPLIAEQKLIATFFTTLDAHLSASTSRLASLKQMKAASLQAMFPQEGETVPKVRFKGFEGEWKTRSLNNYAKKRTEKNVNRIYNVTLTNSAEFGIIDQRQFFDHDISNSENIDGYFVVRDKDFVYNPRISASAPVGPINQNKLGYPGVMSPLYLVFEVKGINHDFLEIYFHTALWHKYMFDNGNSGARFDRLTISDDDFMRMPIPDISLAEQQSIASFFTSLDRQIALHTQRLEKLKQIKAACLDKMFA